MYPLQDSSPNNSSSTKTNVQAIYNDSPHKNITDFFSSDINKIISSFLDEFKALIHPLLALLTKVVSSLLDKKKMVSPSPTNASLLIFQFNTHGLRNHLNELQTTLYTKRIDIAIITETHFTKNSYSFIPRYKLINTNHPDNTLYGGVAIFVNSTLEFQVHPSFCQDYIQSCALTMKPFTIAALYSSLNIK